MRVVLWTLAGLPLSTLLVGFSAAFAVIVALYILRLRRRRVAVAFLALWEKSLVERKASALRSRLQRLLSLLLSLLLVGALILALGDPRPDDEEKGGRSIAVLIDVSASMAEESEGRSRLEVAQERITQWMSSLGPGDEMLLIELGARPRPLGPRTSNVAVLSEALEDARVLDVSSNLKAGLQLAQDALRGKERPEIILVSDGALPSIDPKEFPKLAPFFFEPVAKKGGTRGQNVGITSFSARRYPLSADRFEVLVELSNAGKDEAQVELSLFEANEQGDRGAQLDMHQFTLPPEGSISQAYENLDQARSLLIAEVKRIDSIVDPFSRDNVARALLAERTPAKILVVGAVDNFLEAALLVDEGLEVKRVEPSQYPPPGEYDVTIFDGTFPKRRATTGAALYLGTPEQQDDFPLGLGDKLSMFGFDTWKEESTVFRMIDPYNIQVLEGRALLTKGGDEVLGASNGKPILVRGERSEGRFLALAFSPRKSDFVLRTAFPLFILNVIDELFPRGRSDAALGLRTGMLWRPSVPTSKSTVRVSGPLSAPRKDVRTVPVEDGRAVFFGHQAGFYEAETETGRVRFAGSILSGEEATLEPNDVFSWGEKTLPRVQGMQPQTNEKPWFWLLLGVFVVSFIEWWLYHRRWTV